MDIIPYKIKLLLPTVESFSKFDRDDLIFVTPYKVNGWTSDKELKKIQIKKHFIRNYDTKDIHWEKVDILNSGFEIKILELQISRFMYFSYPVRLVQILHPELSKYPIPIVTFIRCIDLINLIYSSGYISDKKIHGTFCHSSVFSLYMSEFIIEDPSNSEYVKRKEDGKLLAINLKTTKWIPGGIYLLSNGKKVLYFGKIERNFVICNKKESSLLFDITNYSFDIEEGKEECHLFMPIDSCDKDILSFINSSKGYSVSYFVEIFLNYLTNNNYSAFLPRALSGRQRSGLLVETFLKDDSVTTDLSKLITNFYTTCFKNTPELKYLPVIDPSIVVTNIIIKEKLLYYVKQAKSRIGINDVNELIKYIKTTTTKSLKYSSIHSTLNIYYYLGDENFREILK